MNRKITKLRTFRESSAHKHLQGPVAMKRGLFCRNQRRLRPSRWVRVLQAPRAVLALPAAALLLYSCDPPASPSSAVREVTRISGLPNMAQIERRLNDQYAQSARSTDGVEFAPPKTSGTTVSAVITYAEGKLLPMEIGSTEHRIKTITITREVDGKTIPTTVEYKDDSGTTRKTITSRYVPPPNAEAETEGRKLHISGEERDGADNILRTFTAVERTGGGTTTLQTTYRSPDKEGLTETITTENGILTRKEVIYPDKDAAAKNIKTETITYKKSESAMFYPAGQKLTLAVYRDADGEETKRDEAKDDGSMLTTMRDKSTITTTFRKDGSRLAVHKNKDGTETKSVETRSDGSTITTKTTAGVTTKELVIPPSVTAIEDRAFYEEELTKVTIRNGVKTIGENAFQNNKLTKLTIPPSVTKIGDLAFQNNKLRSLTIGNGVETIGRQAFYKNELNELTIGESVQVIGKKAFAENRLKSLEIPPSVTEIGDSAFRSNKLDELTIGNGVKTIGRQAFTSNQLTKLTIPPSVDEIGEEAFAGNQLTEVTLSKELYDKRGKAFIANRSPRFRGHNKEYW